MNARLTKTCVIAGVISISVVFLLLGIIKNTVSVSNDEHTKKTAEKFVKYYKKEESVNFFSKGAGIKKISDKYVLDSKYHEPGKFVVYYGELAYSGISDYSVYDFIVVHDRNYDSVQTVKNQGCKVFQYISFGNRFKDEDIFIDEFTDEISTLKEQNIADGVFLDECEVSYWNADYPNQQDKCNIFYDRLKAITDYCKSIGIETIVNGSRAFCELGDYFLWESFAGYWSTNSLIWSENPFERTEASNGAVTYKLPLSGWKTGGSCFFDGNVIRDGENGYIEMTVDMDTLIKMQDRKQTYDWVYLQWYEKSLTDTNCDITAWTGDLMPFDGQTWTKLSISSKSKANSWNGIGKTSKYLKIRMDFKDSKELKINSIQLAYNYLYKYWDMNDSNGQADKNPFLWNYNNAQRDYLWQKNKDTGNEIKVLAHTYGREDDEYKKMFSCLASKIWGYHSFDYVNPRMQTIYDVSEIENPIGMLLEREGEDIGYFTGAIAKIDTSLHSYSLSRNEPDYWYKRQVSIDGDTNDWNEGDVLSLYKSDVNVKKLSVKDDSKYIYFSFEVEESIDFEEGSEYLYEIYLNTTGQDARGYTGTWWTAPFGADYKISNGNIYKWNEEYPKDSYRGWDWLGETNVTYKISDDKKSVEYGVRKDRLGGLESKSIKIYMGVENTNTKSVDFLEPLEDGLKSQEDGFVYTQKNYKLNTPHGWFRSEEETVTSKNGVGLTWEQNTPKGTYVKAWMRTKQKFLDWSDWQQVRNGEIKRGNYEKVQCCFGLYTNDGIVTPTVKNINYLVGE